MEPLFRIADKWLWPDKPAASPYLRWLQLVGRYLFALARDMASGELSLRAMSLVYTTMLAIVPALGFAFAIAKGLGIHRELEPLLLRALEPIGDEAENVTQQIIAVVDNVSGAVLGTVSIGILLLTVVSMAQKVENSFNFVWRVDRPRSFGRRFSEYLTAILIGPLIVLIALSLIASLSSAYAGDTLPYLMTVCAFAFLYMLIPNTRVRLRPALIGGLAGGIAWTASGYIFANLVATSARYDKLYSGFAIVLILMLWLYLSWLILLLGSQLAYYIQYSYRLRFGRRTEPIDNDARERLSLAVMYLIARDFAEPRHGWTDESLAAELSVRRDAIESILASLQDSALLVTSAQRLIPGRDPHRIPLTAILAAVRGDGREWSEKRQSWTEAVDAIADRIEDAIEAELGTRTLGQLVDESLAAGSD
jgi:membrane protein